MGFPKGAAADRKILSESKDQTAIHCTIACYYAICRNILLFLSEIMTVMFSQSSGFDKGIFIK